MGNQALDIWIQKKYLINLRLNQTTTSNCRVLQAGRAWPTANSAAFKKTNRRKWHNLISKFITRWVAFCIRLGLVTQPVYFRRYWEILCRHTVEELIEKQVLWKCAVITTKKPPVSLHFYSNCVSWEKRSSGKKNIERNSGLKMLQKLDHTTSNRKLLSIRQS